MTDRSATSAMATQGARRASLIGLAPPRREWLKRKTRRDWLRREVAKADAQLRSIEHHVRAQEARIAELERGGAETADALDFLATLQACQQAHETYRLHLSRELTGT